MTSCNVVGLFPLINGRRVSVLKNDKTHYFHQYETTITCLNDHRIPAVIRVYSPPNDVISAPDNSLALVCALAAFKTNSPVLLDAFIFFVLPGDPTSPSYSVSLSFILHFQSSNTLQDNAPDFIHPLLYVIGHVSGAPYSLNDLTEEKFAASRAFQVTTADFVQGAKHTSFIEYVPYHFVFTCFNLPFLY